MGHYFLDIHNNGRIVDFKEEEEKWHFIMANHRHVKRCSSSMAKIRYAHLSMSKALQLFFSFFPY